MLMNLTITSHAKKQIKKLPKAYQIIVIQKIRRIKSGLDVGSEKLSGYRNFYKNRVGIYRIIFIQNLNEVEVVLVAHRKEAYLLLKRIVS